MKIFFYIIICFGAYFTALSQGLINNGANINISNGGVIYVDGGSAGNYTSQNGGTIYNNSTGATVAIEGDWYNNSNNVGYSNDGSTTMLAGAGQIIGGTYSTAFYNLYLTGSSTKSLAIATTTVGGQTTLIGVLNLNNRPLDLNSNRLDVTNSATTAIVNSTGYIISETNVAINPSIVRWYMRTTSGLHTIPFGVSGTLIPFGFNVTSAMSSASAYVDVSTRATATSNNTPWAGLSNVAAVSQMYCPSLGGDGSIPVVIDRWWDITSSHAVTANVTFTYRGIENTLSSPYNTGNIGAQHWNGTGWDAPIGSAPAVSSGTGAVTANGLSTFSPWVLASVTAPLPIELTDFSANCVDNHIVIYWTTSSEHNNAYFTLEKSFDGHNFTDIVTINGAGNSQTTHHYHYSDNTDNNRVVYYRLRQTDFNGYSKTFNALSVQPCEHQINEVKVNNTQEGQVSVVFTLQQAEQFSIQIYDMRGRLVKSDQLMIEKEFDSRTMDTRGLEEAYYMLLLQSNSVQKIQKIYVKP